MKADPMTKTEKGLRSRIKCLQARIKHLEETRDEIYRDRERFREYFKEKFEWFVKLHGEKNYPKMEWLIVDMAKFLNRAKGWYWG